MSDSIDFSLPQLVDLALCSPEVGAVNFNILRILLHEILKKSGADKERAQLNDLESHQIQNFKNYIEGAGTASPMPGVLRLSEGNAYHRNSLLTPRSATRVDHGKSFSVPAQDAAKGGGSNSSREPRGLEGKVARLERHLEALYQLPTNQQILGDKETQQGMSVNDMWQIIQLNNRIAAAEAAIQKMASLIEDLAREMKTVRGDSNNLRRDTLRLVPLADKFNQAQNTVQNLQNELHNMKNQLTGDMQNLQQATGIDPTKTPSFMKIQAGGKPGGPGPSGQLGHPTGGQQQAKGTYQPAGQQNSGRLAGVAQGDQYSGTSGGPLPQGQHAQQQFGPNQQGQKVQTQVQQQAHGTSPQQPGQNIQQGQFPQTHPGQVQQLQAGQGKPGQPGQVQQVQPGQFQQGQPGQFQQDGTGQYQQGQPRQSIQVQPGQFQQGQPRQSIQIQPGQFQQGPPGQLQQVQPGQVQQGQVGQLQQVQPGQVQQGQAGQFQKGQPEQVPQGQQQGQPGQFQQGQQFAQGQPSQPQKMLDGQIQPGQFEQAQQMINGQPQQGITGQFQQPGDGQAQPGQFQQHQQFQGQPTGQVYYQSPSGQYLQVPPGQIYQGQPQQQFQSQPGQNFQGQPGQSIQGQPGQTFQGQPKPSIQDQLGEIQQIYGDPYGPVQPMPDGQIHLPHTHHHHHDHPGQQPGQPEQQHGQPAQQPGQQPDDEKKVDAESGSAAADPLLELTHRRVSEAELKKAAKEKTGHGHASVGRKGEVSGAHPERRKGSGRYAVNVMCNPLTGFIHKEQPSDQPAIPTIGTGEYQYDELFTGNLGTTELVQRELQQQYAQLQGMQRQMAQEIQDKMEFVYQRLLREIGNQHFTTSPYMSVGQGAEKCLGPGVCTGHGLPADVAICQFPQAAAEKFETPWPGVGHGGQATQPRGICTAPGGGITDVCPGRDVCPSCKNDIIHHLRATPGRITEQPLNLPRNAAGISLSNENLLLNEARSMTLLPKDLEELRQKVKDHGKIPDIFDEIDVLEKLATVWEAINILKKNEEAMAVRVIKQDALLKQVPDVIEKIQQIPLQNLEAIASANLSAVGGFGNLDLGSVSSTNAMNPEDMRTVFANLSNLVIDVSALKDKFDMMSDLLKEYELTMVTKAMLVDVMSDKADKSQLNTKVAYDEFGGAMDALQDKLQKLLIEVFQKNENWKTITDTLADALNDKLDKAEIGPLRAYFKSHLGRMEEKVAYLTRLMEEPDPAGTRKKLLKDYNCISCDRHANISGHTNSPTLSLFGPINAGHTTASQRAFEISNMRTRKSRFDPNGKNYTMTEKQRQAASREDERLNPDYSSRATGIPGSKQGISNKEAINLVNRYVGGSHTTVSNTQRVSVFHGINKRPSTSLAPYASAMPDSMQTQRPITSYYDEEEEEEE